MGSATRGALAKFFRLRNRARWRSFTKTLFETLCFGNLCYCVYGAHSTESSKHSLQGLKKSLCYFALGVYPVTFFLQGDQKTLFEPSMLGNSYF